MSELCLHSQLLKIMLHESHPFKFLKYVHDHRVSDERLIVAFFPFSKSHLCVEKKRMQTLQNIKKLDKIDPITATALPY